MRRSAPAVLLAVAVVVTGGCSSDGGTPQLRESADRGYVAGDRSVVQLTPDQRDGPVQVSGETLDGDPLDIVDLRGGVVVLNVWGSWCPPCRAEAPDLVAAHDELAGMDVTFVGINIQDASTTNARRYEESFDIPYESIFDRDGRQLLNLRGDIPPNAIPSTLVLDRSGAVAARAIGQVDRATLVGLVEDVLSESTTASAGDSATGSPTSATGSPTAPAGDSP